MLNPHQATGQHEHLKTMFLLVCIEPPASQGCGENTAGLCNTKGLSCWRCYLLWGRVGGIQIRPDSSFPGLSLFTVSFVLHFLLASCWPPVVALLCSAADGPPHQTPPGRVCILDWKERALMGLIDPGCEAPGRWNTHRSSPSKASCYFPFQPSKQEATCGTLIAKANVEPALDLLVWMQLGKRTGSYYGLNTTCRVLAPHVMQGHVMGFRKPATFPIDAKE